LESDLKISKLENNQAEPIPYSRHGVHLVQPMKAEPVAGVAVRTTATDAAQEAVNRRVEFVALPLA
jgi:hypothetical protein